MSAPPGLAISVARLGGNVGASMMAHGTVGWDVGGANLKACVWSGGQVLAAAQWPMPLWQGLPQLQAALAQARAAWPAVFANADTRHVATMTGEMVDLFANRADGVTALAAALAQAIDTGLRLWTGLGDTGCVSVADASAHWTRIASANWRAPARWLAASARAGRPEGVVDGLWVDIGSTTTDLVAVRGGEVLHVDDDDGARLERGTLVYQGVARTPLCALGQRVPVAGRLCGVMNEWFATTADVYRLTGELRPAHDPHPAADGGAKTAAATRQRLARMVGRDADAAPDDAWLALAQHWRDAQLAEIAGQARRVLADAGLPADAPLIVAGCGDFLGHALARRLGRRSVDFARFAAPQADADTAGWVQVAAPAVAVAALAAGSAPTIDGRAR